MKVVCLTESVSRLGGGLFDAERRLQQTVVQHASDIETTIIGIHDRHAGDDLKQWQPLSAETVNTSNFPGGLGYSIDYRIRLNEIDPDLVYCIGLWKYFSRACLRWHQTTARPYIVAPHGMLDEWAMQHHRLRKKVVWALYQGAQLKNAACIRALNESEAHSIRKLGLTNPICIIPNGVDLPQLSEPDFKDDGLKRLLFLGRIHPKKGLKVLLDAWKQVQQSEEGWRLQITGWGEPQHVAQIETQIAELELTETVELLGPVFDQQKSNTLHGANAFVLPSFSEGMPMTVLEAWSYGLPVIMTPFCNIPAGEQHQACLMCQPESDSVAEALAQLFEMNGAERTAMGDRGRKLVENQFTWETVAANLNDVYRWLVNGAERPNSVCLD